MIRSGMLVIALCATLLALTQSTAPAQAGTYSVSSCQTPSGRSVGIEGWSAQNTIGQPTSITSSNSCQDPGGGLHAHLTGGGFARWAVNASAGWVFRAPPATTVVGFRANVCGLPSGLNVSTAISWPTEHFVSPLGLHVRHGTGVGWLGCSGLPGPGGTAGSQQGGGNVAGWDISTPALWFSVICSTTYCENDEDGYGGYFHIYSFTGLLHDPSAPTVSAVSGQLANDAVHQGNETVTFNADDEGAGVYRAIAQARVNGHGEWRTLTEQIVDANSGKCVPNGESASVYEFDALTPCRRSVQGASLTLDTRQLPPGDHTLRVLVEDAAGNSTDVIPARTFHVTGPTDHAKSSSAGQQLLTANNGTRASRTAVVRLRGSAKRRVGYGRRVTVTGRLLDEQSRPIAGAVLQVTGRRLFPKTGLSPDAQWDTIGQVTTTKTGTFTARIPAGSSRNVLFVYRANSGDSGWTSTAQLDVVVSAKVTLRAKRARVRNRRSAVFLGRIAGQGLTSGVLVTLQVAQGSKWIPVATSRQRVRSDRRGRFRLSYRFQRTTRPATFRFRVVANEDSAFAYDEGHSKTVKIHVRP